MVRIVTFHEFSIFHLMTELCLFLFLRIDESNDIFVRCKILRATTDKYEYAFADSTNKVFKIKILKTLVDSINYNFYDSNLVQNKIFTKITKPVTEEIIPVQKNWKFILGVGLNVESIIEFNNPFGSDKKVCRVHAL